MLAASLLNYRKARTLSKKGWNPAKKYSKWGLIICGWGILVNLFIVIYFTVKWTGISAEDLFGS